MKSCEQVIVTLKFEYQDIDMELPTFLPWKFLQHKILDCLIENESRQYASYSSLIALHANNPLKSDDTLASRGIWDGSILICTRE